MDARDRILALWNANIEPASLEAILQEARRIEEEFPHIRSSLRWMLEIKRGQVEFARNNPGGVMVHLKKAIVLNPYHDYLTSVYSKMVPQQPACPVVILIVSCYKYRDKALRLASQFETLGLEYRIIIGRDVELIGHPKCVAVDAPDNYESLPRKVVAALTWVYETLGRGVAVCKIDDDVSIADGEAFKKTLPELLVHDLYAGRLLAEDKHDRCWHFHKCQSPEINLEPYGRPYIRPFAHGPFYFLPAKAVESIVLQILRFPGLMLGEWYEDKLIGDLLAAQNFEIWPIRLDALGLEVNDDHRFFTAD